MPRSLHAQSRSWLFALTALALASGTAQPANLRSIQTEQQTTSKAASTTGLVVRTVIPGSAGEQAGIRKDDRLLSYDGRALISPDILRALVDNTIGRTEVALILRRGQETLTLHVPVGELGLVVRPELSEAELQLHDEVVALMQAGNQVDGARKLSEAAARAHEEGHLVAAAWLYGLGGQAHRSLGKWKEARQEYERGWSLLKDSMDVAARSRMLLGLGACSRTLGDFASARNSFELSLKENTEAGYAMWAARDLDSLGFSYSERGDLSAANDYHARARGIFQRLAPDSLPAAANLDYLGRIAMARGDLATAHEYFTETLAIEERLAPDSKRLASTLVNLGMIVSDRGDLAAADDKFSRALRIFDKVAPNSLEVALCLNNLGSVAHKRSDHAAAYHHYSRALPLLERLSPNSVYLAGCLVNLGSGAMEQGKLDEAETFLARALPLIERLDPDSLHLAGGLHNLGTLAHRRGDLKTAHAHHLRALEIRERLAPGSLDVAVSLYNLGAVAHRRNDLAAAYEHYSRALSIEERLSPGSVDYARTLHQLGHLAFTRGDLSQASRVFSRAVELIETHRRQIAFTESRALLVERHAGVFADLLRTFLALNDLPAAFATIERARARSLVELLSESRADLFTEVPQDLLQELEGLEGKRDSRLSRAEQTCSRERYLPNRRSTERDRGS